MTRPTRWIPAGLILAGVLAYANSFSGVLILDDLPHILDNPGIRHLGPWRAVVSGPGGIWRPLLQASFALNYVAGGLNPWGYHAVNLVIHLLAGLVLYGLVRRTLELPGIRRRDAIAPAPFAGAASLLWLVHPI